MRSCISPTVHGQSSMITAFNVPAMITPTARGASDAHSGEMLGRVGAHGARVFAHSLLRLSAEDGSRDATDQRDPQKGATKSVHSRLCCAARVRRRPRETFANALFESCARLRFDK
jgi:hypothetical protein